MNIKNTPGLYYHGLLRDPQPLYLGIVGLEEIYVVVEDLDEELRVNAAGEAHIGDLKGSLQTFQHSARVAATGHVL